MSSRIPEFPPSPSAKPSGSHRMVVSAAWPSVTRWYGPAGFVAEGRPLEGIDAELKIVTYRLLTLIGGLSK
jgi:hypothetical protein